MAMTAVDGNWAATRRGPAAAARSCGRSGPQRSTRRNGFAIIKSKNGGTPARVPTRPAPYGHPLLS